MKSDERTNNDLQNITQKTKDWATRTTLQQGMNWNSGALDGKVVPVPLMDVDLLFLQTL